MTIQLNEDEYRGAVLINRLPTNLRGFPKQLMIDKIHEASEKHQDVSLNGNTTPYNFVIFLFADRETEADFAKDLARAIKKNNAFKDILIRDVIYCCNEVEFVGAKIEIPKSIISQFFEEIPPLIKAERRSFSLHL